MGSNRALYATQVVPQDCTVRRPRGHVGPLVVVSKMVMPWIIHLTIPGSAAGKECGLHQREF